MQQYKSGYIETKLLHISLVILWDSVVCFELLLKYPPLPPLKPQKYLPKST